MRLRLCAIPLILAILAGCDDALFYPPSHGDPVPDGDGWCAVEGMIASSCLGCHSTAAMVGGLDLEADPHGTLLDGLVVPGDSEGSLLMRKLDGTQSADEGGVMPPNGVLDQAVRDAVRAWIDDGADDVCDAEPPPVSGSPHPDDWALPEVHGIGAKFQELDCRTCHGSELEGDLGPACSSCHPADWKQDCTYCHGGVDSTTGAPPEDIDDNTDVAQSPFAAHTEHLDAGDHATLPCTTCHVVPTDALTPGHLFDDATVGQAEVQFSALAAGGAWSTGTCTVYCHGDGQGTGAVDHLAGPRTCESCHPYVTSSESRIDQMSGEHDDHWEAGLHCGECHGGTVALDGTIVGPDQHVDGAVQLALPATLSMSGLTCNGTCHGEEHDDREWD